MTTLLVEELETTLSQSFDYDLNKRLTIAAICPYIYMHNAPSGTFTLSLKNGATTLASQDFDSAEIKTDMSTSNNYAHVWKVIQFDDPVQIEKGTYTIELSSSGYTYSGTSFLGWIKEHENLIYANDGLGANNLENALSFKIFNLEGEMRILNFADGFTSATAAASTVSAGSFDSYANDAAYEAANGGSANDGDAYYNTTDNKIRVYENGAWVENATFEA